MDNAPKIVNSAILGFDCKPIMVNGKVYMVNPPTIHKIAGAGYWLSDVKEGETIRDVIASLDNMDKAAHALSWFIDDSDALYEELSKGTPDEVMDGIDAALGLVSARNFLRLSIFARNVQGLTASQRR